MCKNANFLDKSDNWTNVYACCSCKLFIGDECLVYIHSLDFPLNIRITKNCTIQYFINLISNRANFAVRGPTSFSLPWMISLIFTCWASWVLLYKRTPDDLCPFFLLFSFSSTPASYSLVAAVARKEWFIK